MHPALDALRRRLPRVGSPQAYGLALGFLAVAVLVRLPIEPELNSRLPPYLSIYPAVVLSSFAGGIRVGALAASLGLLFAIFLWVIPYSTLELPEYSTFVFASYVLAMSITVTTCGLGRLLLDEVTALEAQRTRQAKETVHRIKNMIAVVQAIASKVSRHSQTPEDFRRDFDHRMIGLGIAQDVLIKSAWEDGDLDGIVRSALSPFLPNPALHVSGGPPVNVPAQFVGGISLALYELATNAMKHGALYSHPGEVDLSWRVVEGKAELRWSENSSPKERANGASSGLGTGLIRNALGNAFGTRVQYEVASTQVLAVFTWPLSAAS